MAALTNLIKKRSSSINGLIKPRLFSSEPIVDPSFAQRIRNLPIDLPGTGIKTEVSQGERSPVRVIFGQAHVPRLPAVDLANQRLRSAEHVLVQNDDVLAPQVFGRSQPLICEINGREPWDRRLSENHSDRRSFAVFLTQMEK